MAKAKKKNDSRAVRERNRKIWKAGDIDSWFEFIKTNDPKSSREWKPKGGDAIMGCCINPEHEDSTPSMSVSFKKGFVKCYGCQYYESDPVRFASLLMGKPSAEAIKELQASLGISILNKTDMKALEADYKHTQMKNELAEVLKEILNRGFLAYQEDPEKVSDTPYYYAEEAIKWLAERKVLDQYMHLPIGIMPNLVHLEEAAKDLGVDGHTVVAMKEYLKKVTDQYYLGAVVFIYHSTPKDVSRFRIRKPSTQDKKIVSVDDAKEESLGIFGLGMYGEIADTKEGIGNTTRAIVVEGEFDQMQYACRQIENANFDEIVLSHGGGGGNDVSELTNYGIKTIYYLPDQDKGGEANAKLLMTENPQLDFRIFSWPQGILTPGKTDLDSSVRQYGFEAVHKEIKEITNWIAPALWCKEQIRSTLRRKGLEDDEVAVSKEVFKYAACIGDSRDENKAIVVNTWTQEALVEFGVSVDLAQKYANDYMAKDSEELVFRSRMRQKLEEKFEFIAVDRRATNLPMLVWEKNSRSLFEVKLGSDSHIRASMKTNMGSLFEWVTTNLAIPDFISTKQGPTGDDIERSIVAQEDDLAAFLLLIISDIAANLPPVHALEPYTSGAHWLKVDGDLAWFVINGSHMFKGTFDKGGELYWEQLQSPRYGKFLFDPNKEQWSTHLTSLKALKQAPEVSMHDLVKEVQDILSIGWIFQDQYTESLSLAVFIVMSTIIKLFPQNLQFLASNERGCGKSALYAELVGGGKGTDINLVEHSFFVDSTTAAGMRQAMNGSSRILVIDEFDNQKGGKYASEKMEAVLKILRISSAGEGIENQGTQSGDNRVFRLDFSSMVAGIDPDINDANATRFFPTDLKSGNDNKLPPRTDILAKYSIKELADVQKKITLSMFRHVPKILQSYNLVNAECTARPELLEEAHMQRFKDTMIILMAGMHAAELDWKDWCLRTCKAKRKHLRQLNKLTVNESIFSALLYTANVECEDGRRKKMVCQFLADAHVHTERYSLNESGCGVYLYADGEDTKDPKWYMLVLWQQAINGILRGNTTINVRANPSALKNQMDRHRDALSEEGIEALLDKVQDIPVSFRHTPISVVDISEMVGAEFKRKNDILGPKKDAKVTQLHS